MIDALVVAAIFAFACGRINASGDITSCTSSISRRHLAPKHAHKKFAKVRSTAIRRVNEPGTTAFLFDRFVGPLPLWK